MLRVRNQRASKARSPYAAVPNGTNTVASSSVLARGRRGNRRGGQVRQPVANISNINAPPTQATPPTPAAPTTPATQASTEAGQGMSRSGMIGMIPHNMPPIVNPTPDAPSALSSHVPTNMNQVVKIPTVGSYSRQFSMSNSCSILGDYSSTIDQLLEASISENSNSVWIIGSSIIHWAQKYAETTNQLNLGLNHFTINWNGRRGMVWEYLYTTVSSMLIANKQPTILIIHCGGNNIGDPQNTLKGIQKFMKLTLSQIADLLPNTLIVWSHILPRSNWRQSLSTIEGENSRRRINSAIATFVLKKLNGASIKYPDIQITQKRLFRLDGVHLSDLDNNIYINSLKNAIVQFVTSSSRTYP
ncbi:uncharacterized protein LOC128189245 isoform X1 [Crassostrea angulata]|uniref:uncharacterized protein LOC128189245 isoform X1 n=1 Tax=Magallana angulata TaxID=2784310 RepID=UPI0022B1E193|nr:uncharacterized protein LOC128189245 isoform X1 [Crassostrea angulata]